MVDEITVPTYEQIEVMLTKLATNYSNLAIVFYDIFYNTTPMDVTFQMFDESGILQTYTIPNRAKDMNNILNSESSEVTGSPEGQVEAARGTIFQDLDNGNLYIKETTSGNVGWSEFLKASDLNKLIVEGVVPPEGVVFAGRGTLYIDKTNAALWMKLSTTGNEGWALISADTEKFATVEALNELATLVDTKEAEANKINEITAQSSDLQYPSAPAVRNYVAAQTADFADRDYVVAQTANLADKDFSNISDTAKGLFIGTNRITNCILEAPENWYGINQNGLYILAGAKFLCLDGLKEDGTFNNVIENVTSLSASMSDPNQSGYIFYEKEFNYLYLTKKSNYTVSNTQPTVMQEYDFWYNPEEYKYHVYRYNEDNILSWIETPAVEIGTWETDGNGDLSVEMRSPIRIATTEEIAHVVVETGGTEDNWYRLYKDGWIEAGGYGTGNTTITLNKNFKTAHYTFVASGVTSYTKAVDSVAVVASGDFDWIAKGRVA